MSRITLGIVSVLIIGAAIVALIGRSAGWEAVQPVWQSWLMIIVGIISLIIVGADVKES